MAIIIGLIGVYFFAPYGITQPPRINEPIKPKDLGLDYELLKVKTGDNFVLNGYWIKTDRVEAKGVLILLHGIGGCKEHFLHLSKELSYLGIESIVFDSRAHGVSGGEFCTYGFKEKHDISKIVDRIKSVKPDYKIGIWGNSLGGAIALQTLEIEKRINFGIVESTFTELDQVVYDYKKRILKGFGIKIISDIALKRAGKIGDFDPDKVKPIESIKKIEQPMFMAHGDADKNISVDYGKALYSQLKSIDKELVIIKDGGHFNLFEKGGEEYKSNIFKFIERNLE